MEYRYTDTGRANTVFDMSLDDVANLRDVLTKVLSGDVSDVSRWQVRGMIKALANAQAKAADALAYEAKALIERAKLPDDL
jgi:hypothetical protein